MCDIHCRTFLRERLFDKFPFTIKLAREDRLKLKKRFGRKKWERETDSFKPHFSNIVKHMLNFKHILKFHGPS